MRSSLTQQEPYFESVARDFPPTLKSQVTLDEEYLWSLQEIGGSFKELLHQLRSPYLKLIFAAVFDVDLQVTDSAFILDDRGECGIKKSTLVSYCEPLQSFACSGGCLELYTFALTMN